MNGLLTTFACAVAFMGYAVPAYAASAYTGPNPVPVDSAPNLKKQLVVVDAGHGGPDPGMRTSAIREKDVTLAVAKFVEAELKDRGVGVLMTRSKDTLIALSDRGRIANKAGGDLFISIHVNATGRKGRAGAAQRGYETFFLAEAKTEDARRVEQMENEAVKFEVGVDAPKGDPLSFILNDMAQNEHLRESSEFAQLIQDGFREFHPGPDRGVKQANFAVLRGSYMPAVLVELGFGTSPTEAAFLTNTKNQQRLAKSIAESAIQYLQRYQARLNRARGANADAGSPDADSGETASVQ